MFEVLRKQCHRKQDQHVPGFPGTHILKRVRVRSNKINQ